MELPEELMTLILSKLPAKSLFRFKCVQKSWYSLINCPNFTHLHRTSIHKNDCFIVRRFHRVRQKQENVLSLHSYKTLNDLGNQINLPTLSNNRAWLCGSCDDLVCLNNLEGQILICNPTIRELRSLFLPRALSKRSNYQIDSVALGSDPTTGKHEVVMIGVPYYIHGANYGGDREARLYDFSTDSWRKTTAAFPPGPFRYWRCAVSLNGAFHWCPLDGFDSKNILTFHMTNEVTGLIPLPDFAIVDYEKHLCVSTKSQLSLFLNYYEKGRLEICVMTEYGVKESWTRLFNIGQPLLPNIFEPIPFWDEQRLLLRNADEGQLVSCDLQHHQNLRHFPIDGDFDLYPYSQSLVSVNGIGRPII